jgi:signal transduction histidine kinase
VLFRSGIGLAVCQKIAREHGGDIVARNLPQGGAQLVLEWPLISDDPTAPERKTTV